MEWEFQTLGDIFEKKGSNLSINKLKDDEGDFPLYGAKGFVKNISSYQISKDYIAVIKDGAGVGRVSIHPPRSSVVATLQYLIPKEGFNLKFLYYYLVYVDLSKYSTGSTIPHIYFKDYRSEPFPVISLPKQKQITEVLEQTLELIDKAKANVEKNIENAKDLFQSKLNEILSQSGEGWEKKSLGEICTITAGQSPEGKFYNDIQEGLPFYQGKKLFGDKFLLDPNTWTSKIPKRAKPGDILISVRAPVGSLNITTQEVCIGRGLAAIHPEDSIDRDFLFYYLKCIEDSLTGSSGAVFNSINKKQIENIQILLPSLQVQKQITEVLDQTLELIDKTKANYEKELENLEELKKSILQKAFAGELTNKKDAA